MYYIHLAEGLIGFGATPRRVLPMTHFCKQPKWLLPMSNLQWVSGKYAAFVYKKKQARTGATILTESPPVPEGRRSAHVFLSLVVCLSCRVQRQVNLRPLALPSVWQAGTHFSYLGFKSTWCLAFQNCLHSQDKINIEEHKRERGVFCLLQKFQHS